MISSIIFYLWSDDATIRAKGIFIGVEDELIAGLGIKKRFRNNDEDTKVQFAIDLNDGLLSFHHRTFVTLDQVNLSKVCFPLCFF